MNLILDSFFPNSWKRKHGDRHEQIKKVFTSAQSFSVLESHCRRIKIDSNFQQFLESCERTAAPIAYMHVSRAYCANLIQFQIKRGKHNARITVTIEMVKGIGKCLECSLFVTKFELVIGLNELH